MEPYYLAVTSTVNVRYLERHSEEACRPAPPLVITREQIDWAVERIDLVLKEMSKARAAG
ncbi:MAG: hypothetical protein ACYDCJ_03740 [Gammaproteobacteria bacterium]